MTSSKLQVSSPKLQGKGNDCFLELGIWNLKLGFFLRMFAVLLLLFPAVASATHLMGGWAGYQYLGLNSITGNYKYQVTVKVYRYCDSQVFPCNQNNCTTAQLDNSIRLDVYLQDWLNPNDPNKAFVQSFTIALNGNSSWVPLPGAAQCATAPTVCVEEGIYTDVIELPPSNGGYHLFFERCCRNGNIVNLQNPGGEGMSFYAFVPPTYINNSSPTFAQPPVPYICVNDTASILNTAFDPDGDVVVYSLVHPFTTTNLPQAVPPASNPYIFPIPLVTYAPGYSATQPFGAGGYANVNAFTGISEYLSPNLGYYVVAVELQEFRNNQLIGVTRLDIQIIVINCPPNTAPHISSSTSQVSWVANEGDSLCFPITYTDPNGDSVFFQATGNIFSNPPTNPPATLTPNPNSGLGSVTSQFCWDMSCNQTGNYMFIVQVPDNGCPPKLANTVFTIQVLPYNGPSTIFGTSPVCQNTSGTYSVSATSGTSFSWTVTGGVITSGQGTNVINVNWGSAGNGTVNVTSFNSNGCSAGPITLNVSIQAIPVINAGPNATICVGNSVNLTSAGGGTYSWIPSTGLSNPNIYNPVASPTLTTSYVVTVTSALNCSNTDTVFITVNPQPIVNAGNDNTICAGFSTTIGGSPTGPVGSTYNWSPATGLNSTTLANPTASPTSTTTYTVIVTGVTTCADTDSVTVFVNQPPVANAGADVTVCPGFNTTLSGTGGGTYNWSPSSSLNNPNISNPVASPTTNTTYTLVVTLNNCTDTDYVSMTTLPYPAVNAGPDVSVCIGDTAALNVIGAGTFSWSPSTGLSCTTCTNPDANPTSTTNYIVTITSANSCTNNDTVQVVINPLPLANAGPRPGWVCPGFSITLNAFNGTVYSWSPSSSLSNPNISNPVASPTSATTYTVNITDANGCKNSDTLTVFLNPVVPTNAGSDPSICIGQSVTLGGSPTSPSPNTTYQWFPSTGLNNSTLANPIATPVLTTTYIVATASDTCNGIDTVVVFVNPLPIVSAGVDVSICTGISTTLTASGGISYSWNNTATTTSISVAPTLSSTYTVTGTDANGCSNVDSATVFVNALPVVSAGNDVSICVGNSTTLTGSGANTYSWSTTAITAAVAVAPTVTTTYTVVGTDANGCSNIDSATVFVNSLPVVSAGADVSICINDSTTLTGSGGQTFVWSPAGTLSNPNISNPVANPTITTTYTLVSTDANTCSNTDTVNVTVLALPSVTASNDTAICAGDSAFLSASGGISYTWSPSSSLDNSTASNPIATPTSTTTYTVTLVGVNGCINSDSIKVVVNQLPVIDAGLNTILCPGDSVLLNASGGINYVWNPSTGLSNPNISNPNASPTVATTYSVTSTDANGCSNTDSVLVSIGIIPTANFGYSLSLVCEGVEAQFSDSSLNAVSWSWNFGDGSTPLTTSSAIHTFPYSANYVITLTTFNPPCKDTAQKTISVSDLSSYVSIQNVNVFTPNNDGTNDCFHLSLNETLSASFEGCADLTVFDRWGIPVYHSAYSGACWDGRTSAGLIVPEGTYFYMFDLNPEGAGGIKLKGFITVLR